jgi:hypothetical protein
MRIGLFIFLTGLLLLNSTTAISQEAKVQVKLDTNAMLIGDHVGLKLQFEGPSQSNVMWPMIPDTILGNITVIGRGKIDTSFSADRKSVIFSQDLRLTCFDSGFYTIPQIQFLYKVPPDTAARRLLSELVFVAVHTVKVDTTQAIKPIIGPEKVPITFMEMLPWILGGLLVILIIAGVIWYVRRRKLNQPVIQFRPRVVQLPHETALQQLELLRNKKLWQTGKIKEYHVELTDILRKYIEERFRVPALEQTTAEIIESLISQPECAVSARQRVNKILELADMVKFAKALPVATENESSMVEAVEFVHSTSINSFNSNLPEIKPEN